MHKAAMPNDARRCRIGQANKRQGFVGRPRHASAQGFQYRDRSRPAPGLSTKSPSEWRKEKTIAAKCCKLELVNSKWVKSHCDWILAVLSSTTFAPHPAVMRHVRLGVLVRLVMQGDIEVCELLHLRILRRHVHGPNATPAETLRCTLGQCAETRVGFLLRSGVVCGLVQTCDMCPEGKAYHGYDFGVMTGVYERWAKALGWNSEASLSLGRDSLEQSLVNGQVICFTAQRRSPAVGFSRGAGQGHVREQNVRGHARAGVQRHVFLGGHAVEHSCVRSGHSLLLRRRHRHASEARVRGHHRGA